MSGSRCDGVVALTGGVGGAKLIWGLAQALEPSALTVICNPGDDFEHLGLTVCPDFDTVLYTLAGLADPERGWGRADETWAFMAALETLGGETWFRLGDRDLALHVERSRRLAGGEGLGTIMTDICRRLGVDQQVLPASDDPLRTMVATADGELPFQQYFVRERCAPAVRGFHFAGAAQATAHPRALAALSDPGLRAIVICPSNPFISIDPILAIPGMTEAIRAAKVPVVAVSPIVGGAAIKGPAAKMLAELGQEVSVRTVWRHYGDLIDGIVMDTCDARLAADADHDKLAALVTPTVMTGPEERIGLARAVLAFAGSL